MVNVQQVDKLHDLFKISLVGGFLDPDCEQNTHTTLDPNCTYLVPNHNYVQIDGRSGCLNGESIHVQRWYVIIFL